MELTALSEDCSTETTPLLAQRSVVAPVEYVPLARHLRIRFINRQPPEQRRWLYQSLEVSIGSPDETETSFFIFSSVLLCVSTIGYITCGILGIDYRKTRQLNGMAGTGPWCNTSGQLTFAGIEACLLIPAIALFGIWGWLSVNRWGDEIRHTGLGLGCCALSFIMIAFGMLSVYKDVCPEG